MGFEFGLSWVWVGFGLGFGWVWVRLEVKSSLSRLQIGLDLF